MNKTRVAFVTPGGLPLSAACPPLNLGYLASFLKKHLPEVDVKLFDGVIGQDVKNLLKNFSPHIVGVTATTPQALAAYELGEWIKQNLPNSYRVIGGVHASIMPTEASEYYDSVVVGEGELAILDIVRRLQANDPPPKIIEGQYINDLDVIPSPAFNLMDIETYLKCEQAYPFGIKNPRTGYLMTSRGCPYRCVFCWNSLRRVPPRYFSAKRVVDEVQYFIDHYHVNSIFFYDDEFVINKKRLKEIAVMFKETGIDRKIVWGCQARATTLDVSTLKLMKAMGCRLVSVGFESGSQKILDILKNNTVKLEDNIRAIENAKKVGVTLGGSFIYGMPDETKEEMVETSSFFEKYEDLAFVAVNVLIPYPGTKIWEKCREENLIPEKLDYRKLVLTSKPKDTYIVCNTMSLNKFNQFMMDVQRTAYFLTKIRLLFRESGSSLKDYGKLFMLPLFWYMLVFHPLLILKQLRKALCEAD